MSLGVPVPDPAHDHDHDHDRPGPRPRRFRARTAVPLLLAGWAVLEIWLLTVVARATTPLTVVLLLLAGAVLGALAVRRAGLAAWRNLVASVQPGAPERPETRGAGLAMLGGLLLMAPGFVSDAAGLLCLFPPTRALLRGAAGKALRRRAYRPGSVGDLYRQVRDADERIRIRRPGGKVVQGEVVDPDGNRQR